MYGIVLALLSLLVGADAGELSSDVWVIEFRRVILPIDQSKLSDQCGGKLKEIRLFVSEDRGKSWKHEGNYDPTTDFVMFDAPEDGLYWFAVQLVIKDGKSEPADLKTLYPGQKVFVNTTGRPVKVRRSYAELQHENEVLRKKVEEFEKRLAERDSSRKQK